MAGILNRESKRLDQIAAIDLGTRHSKAVLIQRKGESFVLSRFAIVDAPITEKAVSADLLADHLRSVSQALGSPKKNVVLGLNSTEAVLRYAEVPMMAMSDLRLMLKLNSKSYLQQDLHDYLFDAYAVPSRTAPATEKPKGGIQKHRVLVGGARRTTVEDLQSAARSAGLIPRSIVPSLLGPLNAYEMAQPEACRKEIVALVDIGFKNTSISILQEGDLALTRVVPGGGDRLTSGLCEALGISYGEAEGIKVRLMQEVENNIEPLLSPIGRELRASIDFFEHQQDRQVSKVLLSGGSARSEFITRTLQGHLMIPCEAWNPASFLQLSLPPEQMGELEQVAPMLAVAVGLAATEF